MPAISESLLWSSYFSVIGIWLVTVMMPGPNFVAIVHTALNGKRRAGYLCALGVTCGTAMWAGGSLLGLGLLFQSAGWLYHLVKWAGAIYLVIIGLRMLRSSNTPETQKTPASVTLSTRRAFRLGLLTDLANPKAAAFFTSLFAVAVPPSAPIEFKFMIVASVVGMAGIWYAIVAHAMGTASIAALYRRVRTWIVRGAGAAFVGFGISLAVEK